ncbi:CD63 antigen-like [Oratosquilla oratoria]|uniref:CD63 antigen-like n=1 Tax=Oratosquilla oratoria TaxID=337810 RepID=UPI003F7602CF
MSDTNLSCGPLTVKYTMFIFNIIFFISGLILIGVGGVAQGFFRDYLDFFDSQFVTPAIGIIILGCIIVVISFFGCCGAKKENVCMLKTFSGTMIIVLILEIAAGITLAALRSDVENLVVDNMMKSMKNYNASSHDGVTETWDKLQETYTCCGTKNYTDWGNVFNNSVPDTCCKVVKRDCGVGAITDPESIYTNGCFKALHDSALYNIGAVSGGAIGLAVIQIVGIWMSFCLIKAVNERYEIL